MTPLERYAFASGFGCSVVCRRPTVENDLARRMCVNRSLVFWVDLGVFERIDGFDCNEEIVLTAPYLP